MNIKLNVGLMIAVSIALLYGNTYAAGKTEARDMKILTIKWQRLIDSGETCPRCGSTEKELEKVISTLKQSFVPLGIEVVLEKKELSLATFKKDPAQSNRIWINDKPLETWINAESGQSKCCDVCGDSECRTVEIEGQIYETIPANLIIRAGLVAASQLLGSENNTSDRKNEVSGKASSGGCCPQ